MIKKSILILSVQFFISFICIGSAVNQVNNEKKVEIQSNNSKEHTPQQTIYSSSSKADRLVLMRDKANNMLRQMDRIFNDPFFNNDLIIGTPNLISESSFQSSTPKVVFLEETEYYILKVITPGMDKKDLSVVVKNNVLIVSGKTDLQSELNDNNIFSKQQIISNFSQSFTLPDNIETSNISSKYTNGVLIITIPKDMNKIKENIINISIQ